MVIMAGSLASAVLLTRRRVPIRRLRGAEVLR
jgi:hypothetical protein